MRRVTGQELTALARAFVSGRRRALETLAARGAALVGPVFAVADRVTWSRPVIVFLCAFCLAWSFVHVPGKAPDFTVFYAAGTPGPIYDASWLTSLQHGPGIRPFAYPPTLLLVLKPLHLLPLAAAYSLWVAASCALFVEATGRLARRLPWLVMASPAFVFTAGIGQTTVLLGALIVFGLTLPARPLIAGALLGLAFGIKPQVMLLVPLALALRGEWRTVIAMAATALAMAIASLAFGPDLWAEWIRSLGSFRAINDAEHIRRLGLGLPWVVVALAAAPAVLWMTRRSDAPTRIVAVLGLSLLVSPHAVFYEKTMLLPAGLALILAFGWRAIPAGLFHYAINLTPATLALYAALIVAPDVFRSVRGVLLGRAAMRAVTAPVARAGGS